MSPGLHLGIEGTVAIVIGGSSGIGFEVARGLSTAGAEVVLGGRSLSRLSEVTAGSPVLARSLEEIDVREVGSVDAFFDRVLARHGPPTILINCMGGGLNKPALEVEVAEWDDLFDTHLRGAFLTSTAFARAASGSGYGKIVNMSSTWAFTVGHGRSVYSAAKAGLSHLTAALALEWGQIGIRVNAVAPAATKTTRILQTLEQDPDRERYLVERIPLGRLAVPSDIVGPVLFLASRMSDFVTGHTLLVDGGWVTAK